MACSQKPRVLLALATLLSCIILASASCQVSVEQKLISSWNDGASHTLVQVAIKNVGDSVVTAVSLDASSSFESFWEMTESSQKLALPVWRDHGGIAVNGEHNWGYIVRSTSPVTLTLESADCEGSSSTEAVRPTLAPPIRPTPSSPTTRPTSRPTSAPTTRPTSAPTTRPTSAPTTRPTSAPTTRPTSAPTTRPTSAPTTRPTSAPTTRPTSAPTTRPTSAPTTRPTSAPTTRPTTSPTNPPAGTGGRVCPAGQVWAPAPGTTWQWQLTGTIDQSFDVQMYDIDLFDSTAATIQQLHQKGRVVICYFSTQYEDWRPDAKNFPSSVLGSNLDDWPGERYLDIRSSTVRSLMSARLDLAVSKGCDGVEPDNVDSYSNSNGLGLTAADQISFNKFLAQESHKRGLSVGLKNDLDQVGSLVSSFDWALNEQCNQYGECSMLNPFVSAGKAVFGTEYSGSAASFCPKMVSSKFSWLLKDLSLGAAMKAECCTYASGGCQKSSYSCVSYSTKRDENGEEFEDIIESIDEASAMALRDAYDVEMTLQEDAIVMQEAEVAQEESAVSSASSVAVVSLAVVASAVVALAL